VTGRYTNRYTMEPFSSSTVYYPLATECVESYRPTLLVSSALRFGQG
jgi:hypothetical protein